MFLEHHAFIAYLEDQMRVIRFSHNGTIGYGSLEGEEIFALPGGLFGDGTRGERVAQLADVKLLAPCEPTKVVAVGLNYRNHAMELNLEPPPVPLLFLKPSTSVADPEARVIYPDMSERVDYEAELAVVIGRRAKAVSVADAWDYVLGYTCGNDVTARDLQRSDGQWTRAKGFDTFCPLGPWIETELSEPGNVDLFCRVNGETKQSGNTSDLIFDIPALINFISRIMTLEPGDVIMTGTPSGIGPVNRGDVMEIEVAGIGVLRNRLT
jgi:2-keto-4-pentenoate hydratase/2-oxohepta-3-ene-1,7-dioic acid hydratase in catechol pathway